MRQSTTVRVTRQTRDDLRDLADRDHLTLDAEIERLVRAERQRRMGRELAGYEPDEPDSAWLDMSTDVARADDARR